MARTRKTAHEKARLTLINTLCKISDLDPTLGGKWKRGMLRYYAERLAEVMIAEEGHGEYPPEAVYVVAEKVLDLLESGDLDGS